MILTFLIYRSSFFTVVPPFIVSYLIFDWAEAEHNRFEQLLMPGSDLITLVSWNCYLSSPGHM